MKSDDDYCVCVDEYIAPREVPGLDKIVERELLLVDALCEERGFPTQLVLAMEQMHRLVVFHRTGYTTYDPMEALEAIEDDPSILLQLEVSEEEDSQFLEVITKLALNHHYRNAMSVMYDRHIAPYVLAEVLKA